MATIATTRSSDRRQQVQDVEDAVHPNTTTTINRWPWWHGRLKWVRKKLWPIINLRVVIGLLAFISTLMFYLSHYHVFRTMAMRRNNNKRTRSLTTNITFEQQCINQKHRNRANQKHRRHHLQLRPPNAQGETMRQVAAIHFRCQQNWNNATHFLI